jgi:hypothetical protein
MSQTVVADMPRRACIPKPGEAWATIEAWRDDYSYRRPHSSPGALTPIEFAQLKNEQLIPPMRGK